MSIPKELFEELRVSIPAKIAEDLCSVQPISGRAWYDLYQLLLEHGPMIIVGKNNAS